MTRALRMTEEAYAAPVKTWTDERVAFLTENYPAKGKKYCAEAMNISEAQVRSKAFRLQLKAKGISDAWKKKQVEHSVILTGRKRPAQAQVMRDLHQAGKFAYTDAMREAVSARMKVHWKTHEHPRGATGLKFTPEQRAKISAKSKATWAQKTPDEIADFVRRSMTTKFKNGTYVSPRPGATWKAGWREIGGKRKYFRSRWEANYARYLEWLKCRGEIMEWQHEAKVFWFEGIKRGSVSYLPDFEVTENSMRVCYHEVKGWMDDRSKTKIRRMAKYHPDVTLIVIDSKQYKAIASKIKHIVPEWEA